MNILELLKSAEIDAATEFTQDDWASALVEAWKKDAKLSYALVIAAKLDRSKSEIPWEALRERAAQMAPALDPNVHYGARARVWIASHAYYANNALWDGNYELAKRMISSGGKTRSAMATLKREIKTAEKEQKRKLIIKTRERDNRNNWNTVKFAYEL